MFAYADGGPRGGYSVHRPLSEDPHLREQKLFSRVCHITQGLSWYFIRIRLQPKFGLTLL
jgi:hypothetical protein